jgi:mutator protein MutT
VTDPAGEPTLVVIGLIGRGGRYLIRQRPPLPGSPMPGYWEFPGGKCHDGESLVEAVRRECLEEVGLPVAVKALRRVRRHVYPHGFVELHFFDCALAGAGAEPDPATGFRWVPAADLPQYAFPAGNDPIVAELAIQARSRTG